MTEQKIAFKYTMLIGNLKLNLNNPNTIEIKGRMRTNRPDEVDNETLDRFVKVSEKGRKTIDVSIDAGYYKFLFNMPPCEGIQALHLVFSPHQKLPRLIFHTDVSFPVAFLMQLGSMNPEDGEGRQEMQIRGPELTEMYNRWSKENNVGYEMKSRELCAELKKIVITQGNIRPEKRLIKGWLLSKHKIQMRVTNSKFDRPDFLWDQFKHMDEEGYDLIYQ